MYTNKQIFSDNTTKDNHFSHVTKLVMLQHGRKKSVLIDDIKECPFSLNTLQNDHLSACLK